MILPDRVLGRPGAHCSQSGEAIGPPAFTKTKISRNGHLSPVDTFDESAADADSLMREIESFVDCVRHGKKPLVSGEDGRRALETALQIRESLRDWADDSEFLGELATGTF